MQPPANQKSSVVETLSRPMLIVLRYLFFVLIFYFLLSIAAGLLMPGQEYGRFVLVAEPGQSCSGLERDLAPFNVNQVDFRVVPVEAGEFAQDSADGAVCLLELAGVSESGVSPASAPLYRAASDHTVRILREERFYEPRYGSRETQMVWLLSLLLGGIVLVIRLRPKREQADP